MGGNRRSARGLGDGGSSRRPVEIRSLVPSAPFAGLADRFGEETRVLFVVEGPKAVASRRSISVRTLLRRFREGGPSPTRVRRKCRAEIVAALLRRGLPVAEVARAVGLSGPQSLGRFAQSFFGLAPTKLRNALKERRPDDC